MTETPSDTTPTPVSPGQIQFYDNYQPALNAGSYVVTVSQSLSAQAGTNSPIAPSDFPTTPFTASQAFTVGGSGLSLGPGDVLSTAPPDKLQGSFDQVLPHVILTRRTLPWEVEMDADDSTIPWVAVLLFAGGELGATTTGALSVLRAPATGTLAPAVPPGEGVDAANSRDPTVTVIDVPCDLFTQVVPRATELKFLTHCRQVDTASKAGSEAGDTAWFAAVIANRFPVASSSGAANWTAHLVSLYGLEPYLTDTPAFPDGTTLVRMFSLASWSFTSTPTTGATFSGLMVNLLASADVLALQPAAAPASPPEDAIHQRVREVLASGYAPIAWRTRLADTVTAWYRGPLCPQPVPQLTLDPIHVSTEATIYDSASGMFDQSYAVAWETGRQLALADGSFSTRLSAWRKQGQVLLNQLLLQVNENSTLTGIMSDSTDVQELRGLMEPDILTQSFLEYLVGDFASIVAGITAPGGVTLPASSAPPASGTVPQNVVQGLTALLAQPGVVTALQELTSSSLASIVEWLARLTLLYGVPFANLVPDPRMLPPESIRFFYVDPTWLDRLVEGALSVGVQSSFDTQYNDIMRDVIFDAVSAAMTAVRSQLVAAGGDANATGGPMAGFLLRSTAGAGWPGLEVKGFFPGATTGQRGAQMSLLRMDLLAPDVLLCLFPSVPSFVDIDEPHEALRFGVDDDGDIVLRGVGITDAGTQIGTAAPAFRFGSGSPRILDVACTLANIAAASSGLSNLTPSGFALQMLVAPERATFTPGTP